MSTEAVLRHEIKRWEHEFRKQHGRNATRDDIKADKEIQQKYRQYKTCKMRPQTPQKRPATCFQTPQKTSPAVGAALEVHESPILAEELGPTPQLNGKVMSILEAVSSPQFATPQHQRHARRLSFAHNSPSGPRADATPQKSVSRRLNLAVHAVDSTPSYFAREERSTPLSAASPSPLASQRITKGLSTIISEFRDIQQELKSVAFEDPDIKPVAPLAAGSAPASDGDAGDSQDDANPDSKLPRWKKKNPKRSTRRWKIKARPDLDSTIEDEEVGLAIDEWKHAGHTPVKVAADSGGPEDDFSSDEEWSDTEREFVPRDTSIPINSGKAVQHRNFKRLKLRTNKKGRFGKGRR